MASGSVLFEENDSSKNTISDPQRWALSYCQSLKDMAPLLRSLQAWGFRPHRLQQPPSFYGYKESELSTSPLGLKALSIPFPNRLPPKQGKCSCRCLVTSFLENSGWRRRALSWEWPNLSSSAELIDQSQFSKSQLFCAIISTSSFHL